MQLPQPSRPQPHKCRRNRLAYRKIRRVHLEHHSASASDIFCGFLQRPIYPARRRVVYQCGPSRHGRGIDCCPIHDERVGRRCRVKDGCVDTKVFGQDVLGCVPDPVVDVERCACPVEIWVIEAGSEAYMRQSETLSVKMLMMRARARVDLHEEKFIVVLQPLRSMSNPLWKIPNIPKA